MRINNSSDTIDHSTGVVGDIAVDVRPLDNNSATFDKPIDMLSTLKACQKLAHVGVRCGINFCSCCNTMWGGVYTLLDAMFDCTIDVKLSNSLYNELSAVNISYP